MVEFTNRKTAIEVIRTDEDKNSVDIQVMVLEKLVGLTRDIVPLTSVDGIYQWSNAQPALQITPIMVVIGAGRHVWVGDRVTKIGHTSILPWMVKGSDLRLQWKEIQTGKKKE